MAVYTRVTESDLALLLADYDLGALKSFVGIEQGVENSNFALTTENGRFVLTLFEKRVVEADLPFFGSAITHLASRGAPTPSIIADRRGSLFKRVRGKPAVLMSFIEGFQKTSPSAADCRNAGVLNARLRRAAAGFHLQRPNALGLCAWKGLAAHCANGADRAAEGLSALIEEELAFLSAGWPNDLPRGLIHADLFPDNVIFDNDTVSGVIDFYFACTDSFAYDLAITLNAWASADGFWRADHARALIAGYESIHALSGAERRAMPILLRGAAMRILLTRLNDWLHRIDGALVAVKDPLEYRDLLVHHRRDGGRDLFGLDA